MAIRKLCVDEVTTITKSFSQTVTCTNPDHTPTAPGDECRVHVYNVGLNLGASPPTLAFSFDSQFEYKYHEANCGTFHDYCDVMGKSGSVTVPSGATICCDGSISPQIESSVDCNPGSITTTASSVSGSVSMSFTVTNLCTPTVICVDDTTCP